MTDFKSIVRVLSGLPALFALACAANAGPGTEDETVGASGETLAPPKACPAIAILCIEGYRAKQLPNCDQICVPDKGWECSTDEDCGAIYCITTPCPQPECRGHQCVMGKSHPTPGEQCGDSVCGAGMYCCNSSCGICAPDGGYCIQMACGEPL